MKHKANITRLFLEKGAEINMGKKKCSHNLHFNKGFVLLIIEIIVLLIVFGVPCIFSELIELHKLIFDNMTDKCKNVIQIILLLFFVISFFGYNIFICFLIFKDDTNIRFKKFDYLQEFENSIDYYLLNLSTCEKEVIETIEAQKIYRTERCYKNYKAEILKKYLDSIVEI